MKFADFGTGLLMGDVAKVDSRWTRQQPMND